MVGSIEAHADKLGISVTEPEAYSAAVLIIADIAAAHSLVFLSHKERKCGVEQLFSEHQRNVAVKILRT